MLQTYQKELNGNTVGVVFGCYAPMHQGHLETIFRAKKECDAGVIVIVCGYNDDRGEKNGMPLEDRYKYVRTLFDKDDLVSVHVINDTELGLPEYPNGWDGWLKEFNNIYKNSVSSLVKKRVWYVGEKDYKKQLEERGESAILLNRKENPISATMIRENPIKYWDKIAIPFRKVFSHNILIAGTASEGKTTLVEDLGKYFNTSYSYEYGREYMQKYCVSDWELGFTEFLAFLHGQHQLNKDLIDSPNNRGVFFADTDSLVTNMYAKHYANDDDCILTKEEYKILELVSKKLAKECKWDKIFLFGPNGKFVDDHSRFMKHSEMEERNKLFNILCDSIKEIGDWEKVVILNGSYYENFRTIVDYVKGLN